MPRGGLSGARRRAEPARGAGHRSAAGPGEASGPVHVAAAGRAGDPEARCRGLPAHGRDGRDVPARSSLPSVSLGGARAGGRVLSGAIPPDGVPDRSPAMAWQTLEGEMVLLSVPGKELMGLNEV